LPAEVFALDTICETARMSIILAVAAFLYLAAASVTALRLRQGGARIGRAPVIAFAMLAVLAHAAGVAIGIRVHHGLVLNFGNALSLVGLGMALVFSLAGRRSSLDPVGVLVYPIAAACCLAALLLAPAATATAPESWQIGLHGIISLLAYSTLSVASLVAILMAVQEHALRNHRPLPFLHALPLTLTEALLFQLIGVGFILLGLSLVTGVLFVEDMLAQHLVHKTVLTVAAWVVFGVLLVARWRFGLRGRRAAWLTLAGMVLLLVGYFGVKLILAN
jgi:ABC-type uncharacterized transport system permease subunit